MYILCTHVYVPNGLPVGWSSKLKQIGRRILTEFPQEQQWPEGFQRGGNGILNEKTLLDAYLIEAFTPPYIIIYIYNRIYIYIHHAYVIHHIYICSWQS